MRAKAVLHLFDANVLITASNTYYPIDQIPEFWDWIDHQAANDRIKLPVEILEEVLAGSKQEDPLLAWMTDHKDVLRLKETVDPTLVIRWSPKDTHQTSPTTSSKKSGATPFLSHTPLRSLTTDASSP